MTFPLRGQLPKQHMPHILGQDTRIRLRAIQQTFSIQIIHLSIKMALTPLFPPTDNPREVANGGAIAASRLSIYHIIL